MVCIIWNFDYDNGPFSTPIITLQFEMLSFYGDEHYCPLSLLRVLGASMMDVYEESQQKVNGQPSLILPPSEGFGEG